MNGIAWAFFVLMLVFALAYAAAANDAAKLKSQWLEECRRRSQLIEDVKPLLGEVEHVNPLLFRLYNRLYREELQPILDDLKGPGDRDDPQWRFRLQRRVAQWRKDHDPLDFAFHRLKMQSEVLRRRLEDEHEEEGI